MCGRACLFRREARGDVVAASDRRHVPGEGEDIPPMGVRMEQGANLRGITGYQCRLEGLEPGRNGTPMLFRNLELTQGLIKFIHRRLAPRRYSRRSPHAVL
ncbi:hypothetical protein [Siccirubricoccus deserti]|uniref:hypothetical protein n=1 Tax=Siccirubricoccus deserti TaxID=2013562 RepID=UPI001C985735|nr:hypothetical protein [Siccirubricoccus deserti]